MLFSRFSWKLLEIGLFTGYRKRGGGYDNVTSACLAWDAHLPQATCAWPQILCTWYDVSLSFTPSFYVSRMLRRPLSIKKACWRPYTTTVNSLYSPNTLSFINRFLLMCLISFCLIPYCAYCHYMHSPNKLNELRMRRKKPPLSTRPCKFNGTVSPKNWMGMFYPGLRRAIFFGLLKKFHY